MEFVDTHCHPFFKDISDRLETVLDDARDAGIRKIIAVGTSLSDSQTAIDIAVEHDNVWAAAGAHPHEAGEFLADKDHRAKLEAMLKQPKIVACGEIGLDYYRSTTPKDIQEKALRVQLEAGLAAGKPIIFHVRDAFSDFWEIVDDYQGVRGVVHSFSSGTKQLNAALDRGFYIGLNGIMTFTRDHAQLDAAKAVPLERLLLETDAPFLTPVPFRGQICEPKHTAATAEFLADLRDEPLEKLAAATTANAVELFGL
jgi:TatD DNase family protein